jgi:hypothetical protein
MTDSGRGEATRPARSTSVLAVLVIAAVLAFTLFSVVQDLRSNSAQAHTRRARSRVTIRYKGRLDRFQGRVVSRRARCERRRLVLLVKARRGISDRVIDRDRTNRRGRWRIPRRRPRGRFYAIVVRRLSTTGYGPGPHRHICKRDRSRTIRRPRRR